MNESKNLPPADLCNKEDSGLLSKYCRTKDVQLRDEIFEKHMYLASIVAKRYVNKGIEYEDLYQVACMGLLLAIDRFDCARGVKFSTFAMPTMVGEVKRYFRDKGFLIKLPRKLYEVFRKADRIRLAYENKTGTMPTVDEIASALSLTDKDVAESLKYSDIINMRSLEDNVYNNSDKGLSQVIGVEDDSFLIIENHDFLCDGMRQLDADEKRILFLRYYKDYSQKQVADKMGVSQMQISRIERKVLGKLKAMYLKV